MDKEPKTTVENFLDFEGYRVRVRNNIHDLSTMQFATETFKEANVTPLDVVIDLGAHCGGLSLIAAKYGAKKVYAFEPIPINFYYLVENIRLNHLEDTIIAYNKAVGRVDGGIAELYMCGNEMGNSNASEYSHIDNEKVISDTIAFKTILSHFDKIDYLKIDVEGAEFDFIEQDEEILGLLSKVRFLDLETHPDVYLGKSFDDPVVWGFNRRTVDYLKMCGFDFSNMKLCTSPSFLKGWNRWI